MRDGSARPASPRLGLADAVSIIVGIVVGTAIFKAPPLVFANVSSPVTGLGLWLAGGVLALVGACCYAELAAAYPHSGGDYDYQRRAFGRLAGFMFGWAHLSVIITASIAQMAYVFADYAGELVPLSERAKLGVALGVVLLVTGANLRGLVAGKNLQNVLTVAKTLGLVAVIAAGFTIYFAMPEARPAAAAAERSASSPAIGLAMVFVLYAFGGWNDSAFVASEVESPHRNMPLALLAGLSAITALYVLANLAYLSGLGWIGLCASDAPAAELVERASGASGKVVVSLLVMVSALGAVNGMALTGSRVYARLGQEHRLFRWLGMWDEVRHTPARSLIAQAAVSCFMIGLVGTDVGRASVDQVVGWLGVHSVPWSDGGFDVLVRATAPVFWFFFLLTGIAFFVLRHGDGATRRPFRTPLYPLTPILFCATCGYMLYSSATYAQGLVLIGLVPLAAGPLLYWLVDRRSDSDQHLTS